VTGRSGPGPSSRRHWTHHIGERSYYFGRPARLFNMRYLIFALVAMSSCDSEKNPAPIPTGMTSSLDRHGAIPSAEAARRATCEGRTVFTIDCDPYWHTSEHCRDLELLRVVSPPIKLTIRKGELNEGDKPFRQRSACPSCT
jgi:hypothetical protein